MEIVGVDGCKQGWLCVALLAGRATAFVATSLTDLIQRCSPEAIIAIDIPIGLPERGPRQCDLDARKTLRAPRASSVFPAPIRCTLNAATYEEACRLHFAQDGRRISKQAYAILPKIREVDQILVCQRSWQSRIREVHPELCFTHMNGGVPMRHSKRDSAGRSERQGLIDAKWPGARIAAMNSLKRGSYAPDDLNDGFVALWTAERILLGKAVVYPRLPDLDSMGLRMEMVA